MEREGAELALFITLNPPKPEMRTEAASAGIYKSVLWNRGFPRIQIATVEDLLADRLPQLPVGIIGSQQAPRLRRSGDARQTALLNMDSEAYPMNEGEQLSYLHRLEEKMAQLRFEIGERIVLVASRLDKLGWTLYGGLTPD